MEAFALFARTFLFVDHQVFQVVFAWGVLRRLLVGLLSNELLKRDFLLFFSLLLPLLGLVLVPERPTVSKTKDYEREILNDLRWG